MEPTNNPIPNPAPVAPEPTNPVVPPAAPVDAPVAPNVDAPSASPVAPEPVAPTAPVSPAPVAPATPPVAPNPVAPPQGAPAAPIINPAPVAPVFQPTGGLVDPTAPISVPEGPAAPDPEEVELNSPFKAAGPVPGSIGSAVSGPEVAPGQTPSVAFNDPATSENGMTNTSAPAAKPKAKMSKTTLMLLCVIGGMVVIALAAVLIMQLTGNPIF